MIDSLDIEKKLLGRLMTKPNNYYDNHSMLSEDLFTDPINKRIYGSISKRLDEGDSVDILSVSRDLKGVPDADYRVAVCYTDATGGYLVEKMILLLMQEDKKRKLNKVLKDTLGRVDKKDDLFDILEDLEKDIKGITDIKKDEIPDIKSQLKELHQNIHMRVDSEDMIGIPTGFQSLDKFTGGWQETDLIIIGGASSMGKTSLGLAFSYNCVKAGIPSAIFSYEMGDIQLLQRVVSLDSEVNNRYIMKGTLEGTELKRIHSSIGKLENLPLYVDECRDTSLRYLINKIRQYVITKDVKFVLVDYLQLVKGDGKSREQEVAAVARALKNIAKEMNIVVVALSQLSRGVERREGCRPSLTDLRESGEIEQASDVVCLVYRPEYYGIDTDDNGKSTEGLVDLIFAKGRNIGTGTLPMKFKKEYTKFYDPEDFISKTKYVKPTSHEESF